LEESHARVIIRESPMLRITVSKPGEPGRTATFDKREITVGRTPGNDLVIPEPGVSSAHARILYTGADITLIDLESTNGTFVNGARIQGPHILGPHDEVFICAHRLDFELANAHGLVPNPPAPPPMPPSTPPSARLGSGAHGMPEPASYGHGGGYGPPMAPPPPVSDGPPPLLDASAPYPMAPMPPVAPPLAAPAPIGSLGVPSPVGVGGPTPRGPDEPPTMPPPILAPTDVIKVPKTGATPTPAPFETPARTGSTVSPQEPSVVGVPPPILAPIELAPEPIASLEPVPTPDEAPPRWEPPAGFSGPPPSVPPPPPPPITNAPVPAPTSATQLPVEMPSPPSVPPVAPPSMAPPAHARSVTPPPSAPPPSAPPPGAPPPVAPVATPVAAPPVASSPPIAPSSPSRAGRPATLAPVVARSSASQPVLVDHGDGEYSIESDDLSSLSGPALARAVCARVFAAVFELLASGDELPDRDAETRARARAEAMRLLSRVAETHAGIEVRPWAERIASELCGLGALSARLAEPDVLEIFVHGPDRVLVRRGAGVPTEIDARFSCPQAIEVVVRRLTGTHFGPDNPVVDARTLDGADVYAVHDSVASGGPVVDISLPSPSEPRHTLESLLGDGCISPAIANLLSTCVQAGLSILVCAGPGARSFPLVSALMDAAPGSERHVFVRPLSEPGVLPPHLVVLEGDGLVGTDGTSVMQALVRTAVGLRADRLTVHDVGGAEATEVLAAVGHGLIGAVLSTRACTASEGVARLGTLLGLAGGSADPGARAAYVAQTIDLVVTVARFPDGRTKVVEIAEALVGPSGAATAIEIIGIDRSTGAWAKTGAVPTFFAALERRGIAVDGLLGG